MASDDGDSLRQAVFGANDGLVSTFGLVAGLIGAAVTTNVLLIASIVSMFAGGMSMGLGSYLATKSEVEFHRKLMEEEKHKIRHDKKKAEAELMFMFKQRGVPAKQLKAHMDTVMDDEEEWLEFVLEQKHGLGKASFPNPIKGGSIMFIVFVLCGFIPLVPLFFTTGTKALYFSAVCTAIALFMVGAFKHKLTGKSPLALGMENLLIGAVTGTVGFIAGFYTAGLVG
jgi:vacuolar iron transporter family protein